MQAMIRLDYEEGFLLSKTPKSGASFCNLALRSFVLLLIFLSSDQAGSALKQSIHGPAHFSARVAFAPQPLTEIGKTQLNAILDAADLADLRWSAFGTCRIHVRKFYDAFDGSLPWMDESRPRSQAIAIIQLLRNAENQGLNPEDYDGPRWDGRISALQQFTPAPESEQVRFDVALTVSAMRYISDLHLGRVNPRRFHFELNIDHTRFDLAEFLQQQVSTLRT